jgi:hypothetical protein
MRVGGPWQDSPKHEIVQGGQLGCTIKPKGYIRFQHTLVSLVQRSWEGDWATSRPVWRILADSTAVARHVPTPIFAKQVPEKQLVWTCQAGPSTSRGLVNTWWSPTWHSLSRTRWARHSLHAPVGMQTRPFGLHMVLEVYTTNVFNVCTQITHSLHILSKHVNHEQTTSKLSF